MEDLLGFALGCLGGILVTSIWLCERARRKSLDDFSVRKARFESEWEQEKQKKLKEEYKIFDAWDKQDVSE